MSEQLHTKYRPAALEDMLGQEAICRNLSQMQKQGRMPKAFLFTGPSGTGKTTLARILASLAKADELIEQDAARFSGAEQMRELIDQMRYAALGSTGKRFLIVDECHVLSKTAWNTLLKILEEPPAHLYVALCTTEPDKVPNTIRTRCHAYALAPVKWDLISEYLGEIAKAEKLKIKPEFLDLAARECNGSVRQALVYLSCLDGITEKAEALAMLESAEAAAGGAIDLARMLVSGKGATWAGARKLLEGMSDVNPESIRMTVLHYSVNSMLKTDSEGQAQRLAAIIQAFSSPCHPSEKMAPILLAVGTLLL